MNRRNAVISDALTRALTQLRIADQESDELIEAIRKGNAHKAAYLAQMAAHNARRAFGTLRTLDLNP